MHLSSAVSVGGHWVRPLHCAGLVLDLDRCRVAVGNVDVGLSPLEFATLHLLVRHRGVPMSKQAISAGLSVQVDPRMVDVYVSRARAKLAAAGREDAIATVWGRGYRVGEPDDGSDDFGSKPRNACDLNATLAPA